MSEDLMVDDIDDSDDGKNVAHIKELQQKLLVKCKEAGIESEIKEYLAGDTVVTVSMPNGREKRILFFHSAENIEKLLRLDFEKFVFLGDYLAIANYENNIIEAIIRPISPTGFLFRKLFKQRTDDKGVDSIILKEHDNGAVSIEIGESTDVMKLLCSGSLLGSRDISIKLSGIGISQHNKTLALLRRFTDSLFFQLDIQTGTTFSLVRDRRRKFRVTRPDAGAKVDLEFPRVEFDESPISLYWYARNATGMPLLQFLAFYQVIEYYYPTYSQEEARRRVRAILKDPAFRSDRDADIGKVLSVASGTGRRFGDERSQLRATFNACLDPADLRTFFDEDEERKEFFLSKQKGLTDYKIPLASKDADLRTPVADLIYEIRCKIVHTKGDSAEGEVELLLPFSKEAELLFYDIELIKYIARKVLIAASAPISKQIN